uniref:hypothetical protein n=1 Tax=Maridesulfovibrio frigidus TaxID=340956 RepID=UPI00054F66C8
TATGVAFGRTVASAGGAVLKDGKAVVRGVSKAAKRVAKPAAKRIKRGADEIDQTVGVENAKDFISSFNPGELPAVTSWGGGVGGIIAGRKELKDNTVKVVNYIKSKMENEKNN